MGRDIAEQTQAVGHVRGLNRRALDGGVGQVPGLVESAKQQTGATQRLVGPATITDIPLRRSMFEELLAFSEPVHCLARLAELRQRPGGGGDHPEAELGVRKGVPG